MGSTEVVAIWTSVDQLCPARAISQPRTGPPGRLDNFSDHGETLETIIERGVLGERLAIWMNSLRDGL